MKIINKFFTGILYIFLYFIVTISLYLLFSNYVYSDNTLLMSLSTIFVDLVTVFIFIIIFRKKIVPDFYDFKKNYKTYFINNYKYYIIGLIIMLVSNMVINICIGGLPTNEELNREILFLAPVSSIISMVIIAPINEELITRVYFKDIIKNKYLYIFISGFLFGLLHLLAIQNLQEILFVIPYSALGIAFAKIYYNSNNIWTNIFFHSLHNSIAIMLIFIGV